MMIFHCTDWLIGILLRLNMAWLVTIPKELGRKFHSPIFQLPIATISPTAHTTTAKVVTSRCRDIIAEGVSERRPGKALRNQRVPSGDWLTPGLWDIRPSDFFKTRDGLWLFTHMGFLIISHKIIIEEKKCIKKQTILSMLHVFPTRPFKKVIIVTCNQMSFHLFKGQQTALANTTQNPNSNYPDPPIASWFLGRKMGGRSPIFSIIS